MTTVESTSKSTPIESETLDSQIDDAEVLISDFSPAQIETETEAETEGEGVQDPDSQDEAPEVSTKDANQISWKNTQLVEDEDILEDEVIEEDIVDETAHDDYDSPWADSEERQYPYEVPRPALTIDEASTILGKSIRAIERSIQGKWGNRLPEGWQARKMKIDGESEWRIIPPPGFRIRHTVSKASSSTTNGANNGDTINENNHKKEIKAYDVEPIEDNLGEEKNGGLKLPGFPFSLENFLTSASHKAKNEIARANTFINDNDLEHPTIVIDRSDDVERLLRELADTQKELAQERKAHMEDMRLINQMQQSMRLLEDHAGQTSLIKNELLETREALKTHRTQYEAYLQLPWWQKIFKKAP